MKTPKGTELPLANIKGKPYLQVAHRLVWFREEHPTWGIETFAASITETSARFQGIIKDEAGRVIAMATKQEDKAGFFDFVEKAETGAIGRALALCGYGTQFAPELEEGERLVDSPIQPATPSTPTGDIAKGMDQALDPSSVTTAYCPIHKVPAKVIPAGTSKSTGRPYASFTACPEKGCKAKVVMGLGATLNTEEAPF